MSSIYAGFAILFTYLFEIQRDEVIRVISDSHLFMVFPSFSLSLSLSLTHTI